MATSQAPPGSPEGLVAELEALEGRPGVSPEVIRLRVALVRSQHAARAALLRGAASPPAAQEAALLGLLEQLDGALRAQGVQNEQLGAALAHARAQPAGLGVLASRARGCASSEQLDPLEELASTWRLPAESLWFLGRALAAALIAPPVGSVEAGADPARCPVCGSPPGAALLVGEAGARELCCPLCAHRWAFPRTACPFCARDGALQTLRLPSEAGCWIEGCEGCHAYLKTFDWRGVPAGEERSVLVAGCATLHLDVLAEEAGLRPALPYTALR